MHTNHADQITEGAPSASVRSCGEVHPENDVYHPDGHPPEEDPLEAARALLAQDQQQRMQQCAEEIQQVLDRHGMRLDVTPAQVSIVPL